MSVFRADVFPRVNRAEGIQYAFANILDVSRTFSQVGIGNAPHRFEEILHYGVKRILGILLALVDGVMHSFEQGLIFQHHDVCLENSRFFL